MDNESTQQENEARLESYVERMTSLQARISESQKEMNQLVEDARINGFDLQALRFLVQVRNQHPKDMGRAVLTNLVKYAHLSGTKLEVVVEKEAASTVPARPALPDLNETELESTGPSTGRLLVKATWGVLVAVTLLWLLT